MRRKTPALLSHEFDSKPITHMVMNSIDDHDSGHLSRNQAMLLHYAAIIESTQDAIISKTLGGIITSWNPAAERIFGYAAAEIIGRSIMLLIPSDRRNEEYEILGRIANGQLIEPRETVRVRKDGGLIDVNLTISPIRDPSGVIIGASKIARDITDEKRLRLSLGEALTRFKATMDSMVEGCQIVGYDLKVLYSNDAVGRLLGRSPNVYFGMTIREVYSELRGADLAEAVEVCIRDRINFKIQVSRGDDAGKLVRIDVSVEPVPDGALVLWIAPWGNM